MSFKKTIPVTAYLLIGSVLSSSMALAYQTLPSLPDGYVWLNIKAPPGWTEVQSITQKGQVLTSDSFSDTLPLPNGTVITVHPRLFQATRPDSNGIYQVRKIWPKYQAPAKKVTRTDTSTGPATPGGYNGGYTPTRSQPAPSSGSASAPSSSSGDSGEGIGTVVAIGAVAAAVGLGAVALRRAAKAKEAADLATRRAARAEERLVAQSAAGDAAKAERKGSTVAADGAAATRPTTVAADAPVAPRPRPKIPRQVSLNVPGSGYGVRSVAGEMNYLDPRIAGRPIIYDGGIGYVEVMDPYYNRLTYIRVNNRLALEDALFFDDYWYRYDRYAPTRLGYRGTDVIVVHDGPGYQWDAPSTHTTTTTTYEPAQTVGTPDQSNWSNSAPNTAAPANAAPDPALTRNDNFYSAPQANEPTVVGTADQGNWSNSSSSVANSPTSNTSTSNASNSSFYSDPSNTNTVLALIGTGSAAAGMKALSNADRAKVRDKLGASAKKGDGLFEDPAASKASGAK